MSLFRNPKATKTITCEDVVAAFGCLVEDRPLATDATLLPYEPELIKAALVHVALKNETNEAVDIAKSGFVMLNSFTGTVRKLDPLKIDEASIHTLLDRELDQVEEDFDTRLSFARSRCNA